MNTVISAINLSGDDLGKQVSFGTDDFGLVTGEMVEFGIPDGHPSLWSNPIRAMEIKVRTDSGALASFEVSPTTSVDISGVGSTPEGQSNE